MVKWCFMEQIENRMVVDSEWETKSTQEIEKVLSSPGYHEMGTDTFVPESEAYEYALERCLHGTEEDIKEFKSMLVEWFYSGGTWRREESC